MIRHLRGTGPACASATHGTLACIALGGRFVDQFIDHFLACLARAGLRRGSRIDAGIEARSAALAHGCLGVGNHLGACLAALEMLGVAGVKRRCDMM